MEEENTLDTSVAELNLLDKKPCRLSLDMMIRRHLDPDAEKWDQEKIIESLNKITHLRLDREEIKEIDNLELLGPSVTNVYLQRNLIERIENLSCLNNLVFLMLAGNQIHEIENLTCLPKLALLDLSDNLVEKFDIDEFPQSLVILNLKNNPCTNLPDYRGSIIQELSCLRQLDEIEITHEERLEAGYTVSSDDEEGDEEGARHADSPHEEPRHADSPHEEPQSITSDTSTEEPGLKYTTNMMLLRSQERVENLMQLSKERFQDLEDMRTKYRLPPMSARSTGATASDR